MSTVIDEKKVIYANLDPKEGVVLNLDTKNYYRLNETSQVIWQQLSAGKSEFEIAKELTRVFAVTESEALDDVRKFIQKANQEHLVSNSAPNDPMHSMKEARNSKKQGFRKP